MEMAAIVAMEARSACKGEPDLMKRIEKAMRASHNHWMVLDEAEQFRGALAGAMAESEGDERDRLERSVKALNQVGALLNALSAGIPVDIEAMEKAPDDMIPLRKMWDEAAS